MRAAPVNSDAPCPLNDALNATMCRAGDGASIGSRSGSFVADTLGVPRFARVRDWTAIAVIRSNAEASVTSKATIKRSSE